MRLKLCNTSRDAFTRGELLIVLASVGLLSTVGLSLLAHTSNQSDLTVCANNLSQVGRACHMWASDHGGENPWWVSYRDGGNYVRSDEPPPSTINVPGAGPMPTALRGNAWFQFGFISEELRTARVLVCPADRAKTRAEEFSNSVTKGYFATIFQNRATTYFIGAHAFNLAPSAMLSGDRSLKEDGFGSCPVNLGNISRIQLDSTAKSWTTDFHPGGGNLLLNDGRVEPLSNDGLNWFLSSSQSAGNTHILKPF
ncbi:MAG TPA: hypothetical protein VJ063_17275 [Verrucomicrobiae bacterium]|nr:hypothetical protein [Verrucomicrobiae bacterium]